MITVSQMLQQYPIGAVGQKWANKFPAFDAAHPQVWDWFQQFTSQLIYAGRKKISARTIFGRIRWETLVNTASSSNPYKLNSAFSPYYARKFMCQFPAHAGLFETRTRR